MIDTDARLDIAILQDGRIINWQEPGQSWEPPGPLVDLRIRPPPGLVRVQRACRQKNEIPNGKPWTSPIGTVMPGYAAATAEPDDEPQGFISGWKALRVKPPSADHPEIDWGERILAHSDKLALPRMMAPAERKPATSGASSTAKFSTSASEPVAYIEKLIPKF